MASNKKAISVIVPAYNAEKTLNRCLQSLIKQENVDFTTIVIDDGSYDNSASLLDQYAFSNSGIIVIHKRNAGVSAARNAGIELVATDNFACVDSDDWVEPEYLSEMMDIKSSDSKLNHIWCGFVIHRGPVKDNELHVTSDDSVVSFYDRTDYLKLFKLMHVQMPWNHLYTTKFVKEHKLRFDETLALGEDILFNLDYLDCCENTTICVINKPLYHYMVDGSDNACKKYYADYLRIEECINRGIKTKLDKWNIEKANIGFFYSIAFWGYESALRSTFNSQNTMSKSEKIKYNNSIMRKSEFVEALTNIEKTINPIYRFAYKSRDYRFVLFANSLVKIKNKMQGKFKK